MHPKPTPDAIHSALLELYSRFRTAYFTSAEVDRAREVGLLPQQFCSMRALSGLTPHVRTVEGEAITLYALRQASSSSFLYAFRPAPAPILPKRPTSSDDENLA